MPGSNIGNHSRMVMWVVILLMLASLLCVQCVQQQQQQQQQQKQKQYINENNNKNNNKNNPNDKPTITIKDNRLLSIQRQIMMTEQMVKLYTDRLAMLYQLKRGYQQQQQYQQQKNKHVADVGNAKVAEGGIQQREQQKYSMDSPYYMLTNQYTISTTINSSSQVQGYNKNDNQNKQPIQQQHHQHIVILPPYVINKQQSYVTVIDHLNQIIDQKDKLMKDDIDDSNKTFYDYSHATRLLFYQLFLEQENNHKHPHHNIQQSTTQQQQNYQKYQQTHKLQLTLQIKPNKIKLVTITYLTIINSNNNIKQRTRFVIEQKVTSYQSHPLITSSFKWHHALQFDNLIVGYEDSLIYIKNKQANDMKSIDINYNLNKNNGKILALYSVNQYKVVFVSQYCIGVVNVRSYLVHNSEEIRYEYFLGNRTVNSNNNNINSINNTNNSTTTNTLYWHPPYTRQYNKIRALSVERIPQTNQLMILLSNGQMLLYKNGRIQHSVNIKQQVMREFSVERGKKFKLQQESDKSNKNDKDNDMRIKINLLPGYNYAILTSNKHNKVLIYNITIPKLTRNSNSNNFFAFLQPKVNSLKFQYWMAIDIDQYQSSQIADIKVGYNNQKQQQQQQVVIYLSYVNFHQQRNKIIQNQSKQNNKQQQQQQSSLTTQTTIYQYSLLLNLLSQQSQQLHTNSIITNNNNNSQQQTTKSSYWWNILMVSMIVLGVVCFRKCKQINTSNKNKEDEESLLYQLPQGYRRKKRDTSQGTRSKVNSNYQSSSYKSTKSNDPNSTNNSNKKFVQNKNSTQPPSSQSKSSTSPHQPHQQQYEQKVISQLQSYLQKQGQKLTRQQIIQLVQQMQSNQQQQQQLLKQQQRQQQYQFQRPKMMRKQQQQKTTKTNVGSLQKKKKR